MKSALLIVCAIVLSYWVAAIITLGGSMMYEAYSEKVRVHKMIIGIVGDLHHYQPTFIEKTK